MVVDWSQHFYYDETSPSCLRWIRPAANNRDKFGYDGAFRLAVEAREKAIQYLNDIGMCYTDNHGKECNDTN